MDLTVPYAYYPLAPPHGIAWTLFLLAMLGGASLGVVRGLERGWRRGMLAGVLAAVGFLALTMLAAMVITFFRHHQ